MSDNITNEFFLEKVVFFFMLELVSTTLSCFGVIGLEGLSILMLFVLEGKLELGLGVGLILVGSLMTTFGSGVILFASFL